ncbi:MAG: flavodoxin family protein [Chloroflexi bacterium]|nr:flavodoxin family protein [Chloroflexota bacterium]
MIKVLGICGSPRRSGNSEFLLRQALDAAEAVAPDVQTELYTISGRKFAPCDACFVCKRLGGECQQEDDFQELRDKWVEADVIIYSVPVYHMGLPGGLKCFIDRLGNSQFAGHGLTLPIRLKTVGAIAQGGQLFCGQERAMIDIILHAIVMGCVPVAGDKDYNYLGAGGWSFGKSDKASVRKHFDEGNEIAELMVSAARSTARRCVELALIVLAGARQRSDILGSDTRYEPVVKRLADLYPGI